EGHRARLQDAARFDDGGWAEYEVRGGHHPLRRPPSEALLDEPLSELGAGPFRPVPEGHARRGHVRRARTHDARPYHRRRFHTLDAPALVRVQGAPDTQPPSEDEHHAAHPSLRRRRVLPPGT